MTPRRRGTTALPVGAASTACTASAAFAAAFGAWVGLSGCASAPPTQPEIRLVDGAHFEVRGALELATQDPRSLATAFPVRVAGATADAPAMLGTYALDSATLRFTPRFPLTPGLRYRATFRGVEREFTVPEKAAGPAVVVQQIYPSGPVLPENVLRFYVQFTGPMSQGNVYDYITLLDAEDRPIDMPFLEIDEELWDRSGTRLTLLIDPGRIKNELLPHKQVGPVFEAGQNYSLRIAADWPDGDGRPLASPFRKDFRIGPVNASQPDPKQWKLSQPRADSVDPLSIEFPAPLDHGLLKRMLEVVGPDGNVLRGEIEIERDETHWQFHPATPWSNVAHHLVIDTELEDPSGNSVRAPFEVDVFGKGARRLEKKTVRLPIRLR